MSDALIRKGSPSSLEPQGGTRLEQRTDAPDMLAPDDPTYPEKQRLDRQSLPDGRDRNWLRFGDSRRPLLSLLLAALIPLLLFGGWVTYLTANRERTEA